LDNTCSFVAFSWLHPDRSLHFGDLRQYSVV
jgi:hypothetical protein